MIDHANVACGFHAGDPLIMQETVRTCKRHHIAVGAHPGLPDIQGFGRREMKLSSDELTAMVFLPSPNYPLSNRTKPSSRSSDGLERDKWTNRGPLAGRERIRSATKSGRSKHSSQLKACRCTTSSRTAYYTA